MNNTFVKINTAIVSLFMIWNVSLFSAEQMPAESLFGNILPNHIIDSVCEGDLNNDGIKEYAVFSHIKGTEASEGDKDTVLYYYDLSVFAKQGSGVKLLWTDKGACGYYQGFLSPQNVLLGIGDILNNGKQYLVVRFDEDDSYDLLSWHGGKLVIDKEISLSSGNVFEEAIKKSKDELMYGEFSIVKENNGTKLKIAVSNTEEKIIKISGSKYVIEREGPPVNGG